MPKLTRYTLKDIEEMDRETLTPAIVAGCMHWDPYTINIQAHQDPSVLGFPVIIKGRRVVIPKQGFLNFCYGNNVGTRS